MAILWDALVRPADLTSFMRATPVDQQYILNQILPDVTVEDDEVDISDVTVTQRTAKYRAFDAPPLPGKRDTYARKSVHLPAVSQMLATGEVDRRRLALAKSRGGSDRAIIDAIYDDAANDVRSIRNRVELARGDLLTDGKVTIVENGLNIEADFGVPGGHIVTAGTLWTDTTNAVPLTNLLAWQDVYRATNGFDPGGILMSRTVLTNLLNNAAMRTLFSSSVGAPSLLTREQVNGTLNSYMLPPVQMVYDAQVSVDGVSTRILPSNKIWFLPPSNVQLGKTVWGLTVTGQALAARGEMTFGDSPGIVGVVDENTAPPYRQAVYADATSLPVLTNARALFIATVG